LSNGDQDRKKRFECVWQRHHESPRRELFLCVRESKLFAHGSDTHPFDGEVSGAVMNILSVDVGTKLIKLGERCPGNSTGKLHQFLRYLSDNRFYFNGFYCNCLCRGHPS
jgi:hypothetical protein